MSKRLHVRSTVTDRDVRFHHAQFGMDVRFGNGAEVDGTFEGWGSVHNVRDSYGTTMLPGAWTNGGLDDEPYPLLWMHDTNVVLGTFRAREEDRGLFISGRYDATDVGQRARAQAQSGSAPGLSVGFTVVSSLDDDPNQFNSVRLVEVSQITRRMAATPGAVMSSVRQQESAAATLRRRKAALARARLLSVDPQTRYDPLTDADRAFLSGMLPHHEQAVMMVDAYLDGTDTRSLGVAAFAQNIRLAQTAEINMMRGWLNATTTDGVTSDPMTMP